MQDIDEGRDVPEGAAAPTPRPLPTSHVPWYQDARTKLCVGFSSTLAFLTALFYFGAESKTAVAAFDATVKHLVGKFVDERDELSSLSGNITEAILQAVKSSSFFSYVNVSSDG